jgi:hypothetical protein
MDMDSLSRSLISVFTVLLMVACPLSMVVGAHEDGSATSRQDEEYLHIGTSGFDGNFELGETIDFSIRVYNDRWDLPWGANVLLEVKVELISPITDDNGGAVTQPCSFGNSKVDYGGAGKDVSDLSSSLFPTQAEVDNGDAEFFVITIENNLDFDDFDDITFRMGVRVTYEYYPEWNDFVTDTNRTPATETEYVTFSVYGGVIDITGPSGRDVTALDENRNSMPLYSPIDFQELGIRVQRNTAGTITDVTGTLDISDLPTGVTLDNPDSYISEINGFSTVYLYWRITVPAHIRAGKYTVKLSLTFDSDKWSAEPVTMGVNDIPLTLIVDYTPFVIWNEAAQMGLEVDQGDDSQTFSVNFKNDGNTKLRNLDVSLDVRNWFGGSEYYYDRDGNKIYTKVRPTNQVAPIIGESSPVVLNYDIEIFKYLPAGTHRIPVLYEGYYYDAGNTGGGSAYRFTDQNTYMVITGEQIYIEVTVTDDEFDISVDPVTRNIDLENGYQGLDLSIMVNNDEAVDLRDVEVTMKCQAKDANDTMLINPLDRPSETLGPVRLRQIAGQAGAVVTFDTDINPAVDWGGFYTFDVIVEGTNADTKQTYTGSHALTGEVLIEVFPEGPRLDVHEYSTTDIEPGGNFTLDIDLLNTGTIDAVEVIVTINSANDAGVGGAGTNRPEGVGGAESAIDPFSTDVNVFHLERIKAGSSGQVSFDMHADRGLVLGKHYEELLAITYRDGYGRWYTRDVEIALMAEGTPPSPPILVVEETHVDGRVRGGKSIEVIASIKNIGGEEAKDVIVSLLDPDMGTVTSVSSDWPKDAAKASGSVYPFTAEIGTQHIGSIPADGNVTVVFTVFVDKDILKGRTYKKIVHIDYADEFDMAYTTETEFAIKALGSEEKPKENPYLVPMTVGLTMIFMAFILFVISYMFILRRYPLKGGRGKAPKDPVPPQTQQATDQQPLPAPEPAPTYPETIQAETTPAYAQPQAEPQVQPPAPPPPPPPTHAMATTTAYKTCPTCGNHVPGRLTLCPKCRNRL